MAVAQRQRFTNTDWGLFFVVLMLVIVGLVMVYCASYGFPLQRGTAEEGERSYFVRRQAVFAVAGLIALFVLSRIDYRLYRDYAVHILGITVAVLLIMAILGRWFLRSQKSIQPVELAKVGAMIYIAVWLEAKAENLRDLTLGLLPFGLLLGVIAGLVIVQPDFSTAVLLIAVATAMFFVAGADIKLLLVYFLIGGASLTLVVYLSAYRAGRVGSWTQDPFKDAYGAGFQTVQSLVALNLGKWFGVGLGQSTQKFILYAPHSDCIFAIIAEEAGFVGAGAVMLLYGLWTWRGLRIVRHAGDTFGSLLALGLVTWVTFQAALHIGVLTRMTPFTGTVLPFVSYGGSSLMSLLASVGILLSISRNSHKSVRERRA